MSAGRVRQPFAHPLGRHARGLEQTLSSGTTGDGKRCMYVSCTRWSRLPVVAQLLLRLRSEYSQGYTFLMETARLIRWEVTELPEHLRPILRSFKSPVDSIDYVRTL